MFVEHRRQQQEAESSPQAKKFLDDAAADIQKVLHDAITAIPDGDNKRLSHPHKPYVRLVVKYNKVAYRIIWRWLDSNDCIFILKIDKRGKVYNNL